MDIVTGALGSVLSKLVEFLRDEYNLQAEVRQKITSLSRDLERMHAALRKVAGVPPNEVDELVKLWARDVRELSYTVENILDDFLVRVEAGRKRKDPDLEWYHHLANTILEVFSLSQAMARREISSMIDIINKKAMEVAMRRQSYSNDSIVAKPAASSRTVDPRLIAMYREVSQIIGIDKPSADLISMLSPKGGDESNQKMKIVSVLGVGGLGKTTLATAVYDKRDKSLFDYGAFVPVGQNPDLKKVIRDILIHLDKEKYIDLKYTVLDEYQLINELRAVLGTKRYFVVIDDIWEPQSLEIIKLALVGSNCGSRVIITTRKHEVAKEADEIYRLEPLSFDNSRKLFYTRLFGGEDKCPNNHPVELSDTILKKCGGIPLAIITMSSFLLGKSRKQWIEVCNSPGLFRDNKNDRHMENTMHILSLSYYDLPSHLKTCLLYLSVFPEDYRIDKDSLIWMWIAEGFVDKKPGCGLFEVGEEYFLELINRSMIQGVDSKVYGMGDACSVHDMVLDLIFSMSREENFASFDGTLAESHTRRFALNNRDLDLPQDTGVNLPQVRSFIVLQSNIFKWALHPRLKLIRVLALVDCIFRGDHNLEHIGNLLNLRYLGLRDNIWIGDLPQGIGALKFLQTLNLEDTDLELPCSIGRLTQLVCLRARETRAPDGVIGRLTSLEELQIAGPRDDGESWSQFAKDLGNLCELRVLKIIGASKLDESKVYESELDESMERSLIQSLGKLQNIQHLTLNVPIDNVNMNAWDAAVPSQDLRCLFLPDLRFPKLPSWMNSAQLPSLSHLDIYMAFIDEKGFKALGGLPELRYLRLLLSRGTIPQTEAHGCFQKLRSFVLPTSMVQFVANEESSDLFARSRMQRNNCSSVFPAVAMPNLEELEICVNVEELTHKNVVGCEDLGFEYLPSLRRVKGVFNCPGAYDDEVERELAALRHAIEVHPNRLALQIKYRWKEHLKRRSDDDASVQPQNEVDEEETQ